MTGESSLGFVISYFAPFNYSATRLAPHSAPRRPLGSPELAVTWSVVTWSELAVTWSVVTWSKEHLLGLLKVVAASPVPSVPLPPGPAHVEGSVSRHETGRLMHQN